MSEAILPKAVCSHCGGRVEFAEESEGATVPCPHCEKNLFLYRQPVRAIGAPPPEAEGAPPASDSNAKYKSFAEVPWFRREPGAITLILMFVVPLILLALCIIALTGDVYRNVRDKNGNLVKWGIGNKIAAILILVIQFIISAAHFISNRESIPQRDEAQLAQPEPLQSQQPMTPERPQFEWNTTEIDATKNGNIDVAVNWLQRNPVTRGIAISPEPQLVAKTPWEYFGRVVKLTGTVVVVQDYPAGSDNSHEGQETSDIVIACVDGTVGEIFCTKASGDVVVGDVINLYGYPVGNAEVENRLGGKDTHLMLVGNDFDNLGIAQ